jgi:hypothetical protein
MQKEAKKFLVKMFLKICTFFEKCRYIDHTHKFDAFVHQFIEFTCQLVIQNIQLVIRRE